MKKIINFTLVLIFCFCFLFSNLGASCASSATELYVKSGVAISDIYLSTFMAKYQNISVAMDFVDDIENLSDVSYMSNKYNVSLFAKLDLFCYSYENKTPSTKEDLIKYFNNLIYFYTYEYLAVNEVKFYNTLESAHLLLRLIFFPKNVA